MIPHHALVLSVREYDPTLLSPYVLATSEPYHMQIDQLRIDDVRFLIDLAHRSPSPGYTERVVCVVCDRITSESQHALLKVLEEPPQTTRFIFILPTAEDLLPTVRSRCQIVIVEAGVAAVALPELLTMSLSEAMQTIESRLKRKDMDWILTTKRELLTWIAAPGDVTVMPKRATLYAAAIRLATRGASNKFLLEHIILTWHAGGSRV